MELGEQRVDLLADRHGRLEVFGGSRGRLFSLLSLGEEGGGGGGGGGGGKTEEEGGQHSA